MRRIVFSVFGAAALLVAMQVESLACTCALPSPKLTQKQAVKKARREARAVFSGKVLEVSENPQTHYVEVRLRVDTSWKGDLPEEVTVVTGRGGGDCGYHFAVGEVYLVYAYGSNAGKLETNICQRTAKLAGAAADIKELGNGDIARKLKG